MPLDQTPTDGGNKPSLPKTVMWIAKAIAKVAIGAIIRSEADSALQDITNGINELFEDLEVTKETDDEEDANQ
jgi:hypothetical protein